MSNRIRAAWLAAAAYILVTLMPNIAAADEPANEGLRSVAITFSPLHLISPIFEVTAELRALPQLGIALIAGVGSVTAQAVDPLGSEELRFRAFELGVSPRYYVVGDFDHGMQLGAELLYINVDLDRQNVSGTGAGVAIGPFVGYKVTTSVGFTFDSQLGFQYIKATGTAESEGNTSRGSEDGIIPLLNLNVGWAF